MMRRQWQKGFFEWQMQGTSYGDVTATAQPQLMGHLVSDFFEQVLSGSLKPFVVYLAQDVQLSDDELMRI